jgi:uncharacterized lipoprotein YmbA
VKHSALLVVLMVAACASTPPTRLHSLLPGPGAGGTEATSLQGTPRWELLPVSVPAQVDQPQWVVRTGEDGMQVLEHDRWVAPLADEIRAAVALRIAAAASQAQAAGAAAWRIQLELQRFDAVLGRFSRIEASWSVQRSDAADAAQRCRASVTEPAQPGLPAMASAHRAAVAQLGDRIAASLLAAVAGSASNRC